MYSARYRKGFRDGYNNPSQYAHLNLNAPVKDDKLAGIIAGCLQYHKDEEDGTATRFITSKAALDAKLKKKSKMTVRDVYLKWNAIVLFPWTPAKLRQAGYEPQTALQGITKDLKHASDASRRQATIDQIIAKVEEGIKLGGAENERS